MPYPAAVVERAMKVQEVMLQALSGKLTWAQAEEILGWSPRRLRRWRLRYQRADRARWAAHTPHAGAAADRTQLSQVGRALAQLGIEHILGYSPQARGRSERATRTLQGRLVNELRAAGIATIAEANRYLREHFQAAYDGWFAHPPADLASAFVPLGAVDLDQILCHEEA